MQCKEQEGYRGGGRLGYCHHDGSPPEVQDGTYRSDDFTVGRPAEDQLSLEIEGVVNFTTFLPLFYHFFTIFLPLRFYHFFTTFRVSGKIEQV